MILTDDTCSVYDFLTYDSVKSLFVDENFSYDSFITKDLSDKKENIGKFIELIGCMIEDVGLESLMYENINEYKSIRLESVHIPDNYEFKFSEMLQNSSLL